MEAAFASRVLVVSVKGLTVHIPFLTGVACWWCSWWIWVLCNLSQSCSRVEPFLLGFCVCLGL